MDFENGTYTLPNEKASRPATYKQIKWLLSMDSLIDCNVSTSQLMKRMPMNDFDELIQLRKEGIEIEIDG